MQRQRQAAQVFGLVARPMARRVVAHAVHQRGRCCEHPSWWQLSLLLSGALGVGAYGNAPNNERPVEAALRLRCKPRSAASLHPLVACDAVATAGAGWLDTFIPVFTGPSSSTSPRSILGGNTSTVTKAS